MLKVMSKHSLFFLASLKASIVEGLRRPQRTDSTLYRKATSEREIEREKEWLLDVARVVSTSFDAELAHYVLSLFPMDLGEVGCR